MTMSFCKECNNLLFSKFENGQFEQSCLRCEISIPSTTTVVSSVYSKVPSSTKNKQYFLNDVTLPRLNMTCEKCGNEQCISYMEKSETKALNTFYICTGCLYEWSELND